MAAVMRWIFLACLVAAAGGCASEPDRQWYKPSGSYTVAEFQRDYADCRKNRQLDEACLRQRGWVPLTGDVPPPRTKTIEEREMERRGSRTGSPGRY